jgi:deoxyribodipyrimidine photo-lyase
MPPKKRKTSSQTTNHNPKRVRTTNGDASAQQTPLTTLLEAMSIHHETVPPQKDNVVHWFRSDLRLKDNRALSLASQKAQENKKGLVALYIVSPQVHNL